MLLIVASISPPPLSRYSRENAENPCLAASSFLRNVRMGKNRAPLLANDFLAKRFNERIAAFIARLVPSTRVYKGR